MRLTFVRSLVTELISVFLEQHSKLSGKNLKSCPEVVTFKLQDSRVGIISFMNNDGDIPRLRIDDLDDEEKFRMKKKAAGALLKVSIYLSSCRPDKIGIFSPAERV